MGNGSELGLSLFLRRIMNIERWNELKKNGEQHYKTAGAEPVDLLVAGNMFHDFACGSIQKYAFRSRREACLDARTLKKNLDKIIDYAEKLKAYLGVE
jgi:hypothetical protein